MVRHPVVDDAVALPPLHQGGKVPVGLVHGGEALLLIGRAGQGVGPGDLAQGDDRSGPVHHMDQAPGVGGEPEEIGVVADGIVPQLPGIRRALGPDLRGKEDGKEALLSEYGLCAGVRLLLPEFHRRLRAARKVDAQLPAAQEQTGQDRGQKEQEHDDGP